LWKISHLCEETIAEWSEKMCALMDGYELKDIGNCDETNHTSVQKNENEKPLAIGDSVRPCCFRNINIYEPPVV
jgi:hypothetical protein